MAERRLRIERLVVRMRGVGEPLARELAAGLGEAVLRRLDESGALAAQAPGSRHVEQVDAGSVTPSTRARLAAQLADAVGEHLGPPKGGR